MKIKKLKKFIAGVLSAAMIMSTMAVTAFAADDTIDTTRNVSLTIHKYRMEDTEDATDKGTGNAGDVENVPKGAELLDGVTFNVYRVADIKQVTDASGNLQLQYKTVSTISDAVGAYIDSSSANVDSIVAAVNDAKLSSITKVTGADSQGDGLAVFSNTELLSLDTTGTTAQGLYLVVEGNAPDIVTQKAAPFLVSLPMTTEISNNSEWIYDVHAFPKNGTMTSGITLIKQGKVGNGTASNVGDARFVLQKKINNTWTTITETDTGSILDTGATAGTESFTVPATGKTITGLSQGTYRFIEVASPDEDYIMDGAATYEFAIDNQGNVTGTNVSNSTITVTNYKPTIDKEVAKKDDNAQYGDAADYSTGDQVPFKVTATVPSNINKLSHFILTDKMSSGLLMDDADKNSFVITYKNAEGSSVSNTGITTAVQVGNDSRSWTLDLSNDVTKLETSKIASIEVTFTATLTSDAVTAGTGNPNTVGLEYTNKIYPTSGSDPQNPNTPESGEPYEETKTITDKVTVYTFGLELVKTFDGVSGILEGYSATFDLYRVATASDQNPVTIKVNGSDISVVKEGTYTTDSEGKIVLNTSPSSEADKAFSNGTYYFVETDTVDGYNLLKDPIAVTVEVYYTQTFKTTTTTIKYNESGEQIGEPNVVERGEDTTTFYKDSNHSTTVEIPVGSVNVVNKKGFQLPTTGGTGTLLASLIGILLMGGGAFVFFSSRKKKKVE